MHFSGFHIQFVRPEEDALTIRDAVGKMDARSRRQIRHALPSAFVRVGLDLSKNDG